MNDAFIHRKLLLCTILCKPFPVELSLGTADKREEMVGSESVVSAI
jgi:hypothetical protein